jgi:hypothetical protein
VGDALGAIESTEVDSYLLPVQLTAGNNATSRLLGGFVWRRFWSQKYPWLDEQLSADWTLDEKLTFLLMIPAEPQIWRRAESVLGGRQSEYWAHARVNPWDFAIEQALEAAEKLALYGQAAAAIDCLFILVHKKELIPISLASSVLSMAVKSEDQQRRIVQHHLTELIKHLQQQEPSDSQELFLIEWQYLPLLNRVLGWAEPKTLERRLASHPAFYCEVIAAVFRSDRDDPEERRKPTERETRLAQSAYALLHGWRILPGSLDNGSFDGKRFTDWLNEVKQRCTASGHLRIAMDQLGQALAHAPMDPSGLWIHRSVATALDARDAADMRDAFCVGVFNRRGVHTFSHGTEEKRISDMYRERAKALSADGFHRLADAVRSVAHDYERDSQKEAARDIFEELS